MFIINNTEAATGGVPENLASFTRKRLSCSLFLTKWQASKSATLSKETQTQVLSSEICEGFKNTYFEEHL